MKWLLVLAVSALAACSAAATHASRDGAILGIAALREYQFERVTSTDPKGGNADYRPLEPSQTLKLAEIDGPGIVTHLWFTISSREARNQLILRAYWDGETAPSIDAPLGLFFGAGHGDAKVPFFTNAFFDISPQLGLNCHLPMPFAKKANLTLTNSGDAKVSAIYYYVEYAKLKSLPANAGYLHARYHSEDPCAPKQDYVFAEGTGRGQLVGVNLQIDAKADGWWGEGDDKITIDGVDISQGTGTEDYFCGAWNFRAEHAGLYQGSPRMEPEKAGGKHCIYRFHALDPIPFYKSFRYAIEHGHANDRADAWASVSFWYQLQSR